MQDIVVVTGASGNVGGQLARRLLERGVKVRAVARDARKLGELARRGAEVATGSVLDRAFLAEVLKGAQAAFVMVPPSYGERDFPAYQDVVTDSLAGALRDSGVGQAVTLSSVGAELASGTGPIAGLHGLEQKLEAIAGLAVTHLRATYFLENHLPGIGLIKAAGIYGGGVRASVPMPMIASRDIAAAAAEVLAAPISGRSVRYLLGAADHTHAEVARELGAAIGRPDLPYVEFPPAEVKKALLQAGFSDSVAEQFLEMQQAFNEGRISYQPRSAANTTPTTLSQFAREVFAPAFAA